MTGAPAPPLPQRGLRHRLLRNTAFLGGGTALAAFLSMLAVVVNSRALSITQFGQFVLLQSSALLIAGICTFSTQQPVIKLGVAALAEGDRTRFERIIFMGFAADCLSAVIAASSALAIVLLVPGLIGLDAELQKAAVIVSCSLLFQGYRTSEGIFRAFDRFDLLGIIQPLASSLQLGIAVILWLTNAPFIAYAWLAAMIIALPSAAQLMIAATLLVRRGFRPRPHGISKARTDRREFIAYCWTTSATGTFDTIRTNGDSTAVGVLISVEAAGIYNVAKQLAGILRKVTTIYASVVFPELAKMAATRNVAQAKRLLNKAVLTGLGVTVTAGAGAALLGPLALSLMFGPRFTEAKYALILLVVAAGLQLVSATYSMYAQAFIGPVALVKAYLVSTVAFCVVIALALPTIGMMGAGWAQLAFVIALTISCRFALQTGGAFKE